MAAKLFPRSSFLRFFLLAIFLGMVLFQTGCGGKNDNPLPLSPFSGTISGIVTYEDKEYDQNGFTGTLTHKPVRYAEVEIVNSFTNSVLASVVTDAAGAYHMNYTSYYGYPVTLRVIASSSLSDGKVAEVRNYQGRLYGVSAAVRSPTVNVSIPVTNPAGGAFNILDVLTTGAEFVYGLAIVYPPLVAAYWKADTYSGYGTGYCSGSCNPGPGIYLIGNYGGDTDGYDDDVIWHEYGHFIADKLSRDDSPGGTHSLVQNNLDLRLSWSEGWGDFFPGAVKSWITSNDPAIKSATSGTSVSRYIDTVGTTAQISFDFGDPPDSGDLYMYSSSEVGVAKILWDLYSQFPAASLWSVIHTYIPTVVLPVNLEAFWDGWYTIYNADPELASSKAILNGRSIFYQIDTFESDDLFSSARGVTVSLSEPHYLYKPAADDQDFVMFNAAVQQYTVTVNNLKNGAYPRITVYDASQSVIANGFTSATFTPAAGTCYIEVKPSLTRPSSYGRYGTYTLTIN